MKEIKWSELELEYLDNRSVYHVDAAQVEALREIAEQLAKLNKNAGHIIKIFQEMRG